MSAPVARPTHFPGLDSLRGYAALFVVLGHIPLNQESLGLPAAHPAALFFRGNIAVSFFFTLSGFLITYLLLAEQERSGTIGVGAFYLRRVLRIWPLYFLVVAVGLVFYNFVLPHLGLPFAIDYPLPLAILLYVLFLPNLMNAYFHVGGILNPTWSIGIEEQFYLVWAPLVRRFHRRLAAILVAIFLVFLAVHVYSRYGAEGEAQRFLEQLRFHCMAAGGLAAWALFHHRERLLGSPVFTQPWLQWALGLALVQYFLVNLWEMPWAVEQAFQLLLFPWICLEIGANPRRRLRLQHPLADWLGRISYGLYMLHMLAVYATSFVFVRTAWWHGRPAAYYLAYYSLAIGLTVGLAALSFKLYERPFLALKERLARR